MKVGGAEKKVFAADRARQFPAFDLLRPHSGGGLMRQKLQRSRNEINAGLCGAISSAFANQGCDIFIDEFAASTPWGSGDAAASVWLVAHVKGQLYPPVILCIDANTAHRLTVLFFGGSVLASDLLHNRVLTDAEQRLLQRLLLLQLRVFMRALHGTDYDWQLRMVAHDSLPRRGEWLSAPLRLKLFDQQLGWRLWLPVWELDDRSGAAPVQRAELEQAAARLPVQLRVVLAKKSLKLEQLLGLRVGDVLPIDLAELAAATISGQPCLRGRVAEKNQGLVFQVSEVIDPQQPRANAESGLKTDTASAEPPRE